MDHIVYQTERGFVLMRIGVILDESECVWGNLSGLCIVIIIDYGVGFACEGNLGRRSVQMLAELVISIIAILEQRFRNVAEQVVTARLVRRMLVLPAFSLSTGRGRFSIQHHHTLSIFFIIAIIQALQRSELRLIVHLITIALKITIFLRHLW